VDEMEAYNGDWDFFFWMDGEMEALDVSERKKKG
jgi:hypothetical protein